MNNFLIKMPCKTLIALVIAFIFSSALLSYIQANEPDTELDKTVISSASGVMSDLNFTVTINVGDPMTGARMTDGYLSFHSGQGWTQVSWLRGALSAISIPSLSVWGMVGTAIGLVLLFILRAQRRQV